MPEQSNRHGTQFKEGDKMRRNAIRVISILALMIIATGCLSAVSVMAKTKSIKTNLIKKAVKYEYNSKTKKWVKAEKQTYTYKKAYPTSISTYSYGSKSKDVRKMKYTFHKNGNPKKAEMLTSGGQHIMYRTYRSNGVLRKISYNSEGVVWKEVFQYGAGRFFTLKVHEEVRKNVSDDPKEEEYANEIDYVSVNKKNDLLKKTVNRGLYANWDNIGQNKKVWYDFMGTYTAKYNDYGLLKLTSVKYSAKGGVASGKVDKFKYNVKNGRITSATRYSFNDAAKKGKGAWVPYEKYVFKYDKKKISKYRYSNMINDIVLNENNYYAYLWY